MTAQINEVQQLRELVFSGGWDDESKQEVDDLENRLHEIAAAEKSAEHPAVKPFIDFLVSEIDRCELLLHTDKTLTDRQRDELFARIEIASRFTHLFGGKSRQSIEEQISKLLAHARLVEKAQNSQAA